MEQAAPLAVNVYGGGYHGPDAQPFSETGEHVGVLLRVPCDVAFARLVDLYHSPAVSYGQPVHTDPVLVLAHGSIAHTKDDEGGDRGVVHEGIYLLGVKGASNECACLNEGRMDVGTLYGQ